MKRRRNAKVAHGDKVDNSTNARIDRELRDPHVTTTYGGRGATKRGRARNPRITPSTFGYTELLWYGFGLKALGAVREAGLKIKLPLVVRATQLEAEGLESIVIVYRDWDRNVSHVVGNASSVDGRNDERLLRQRDAHAVGIALLAAVRDGRLPPVVTKPMRRSMHEYKSKRWPDHRPHVHSFNYDALGQYQDPQIAFMILQGFADWRARGGR